MRLEFKKFLRLAEEWEFVMLGVVMGLLVVLLVAVIFQQPPDDSISSSRRQVEMEPGRINTEVAYAILDEAEGEKEEEEEEEAELPSPHAMKSELDIYGDKREKTKVEARKKKKEEEKKEESRAEKEKAGTEKKEEAADVEEEEDPPADEEGGDREKTDENIFVYKGYRDNREGKVGILEQKATGKTVSVRIGRQFGNMMVSELASTKITFISRNGREKTYIANEEIEIAD